MFGLQLEIAGHNTLSPELAKARADYNAFTAAASSNATKLVNATKGVASMQETLQKKTVTAYDRMKSAIQSSIAAAQTRMQGWANATAANADKITGAAHRIGAASDWMQRKAVDAFNKLKIAAAAAAVSAFIVGSSFEQALARVSAVTNSSKQEVAQMSTEARRLGSSTMFGAKDVAQAMSVIGESTGNAGDVIASIGPIVQFAGGQAMELGQAAEFVSQQMDAFGLSTDQASRFTNAFAAGIGQIDTKSLQDGLTNAGATAHTLGLSLEQTIALFGLLDQGGKLAGQSAAGLQGVLFSLLNPTDELKQLMGGLTVETDGVMAVMQRLASQGQGALAQAFDKRQLGVVLTLVEKGSKAFEDLTAKVTGTARAAEMYDTQMNTTTNQLKLLRNMVGVTLIEAFQAFAGESFSTLAQMQDAVMKYKAVIVGAVVAVRDFVAAHRDQIAAALELAVKLGVLFMALGLIVKIVATAFSAFQAFSAIATVARVAFGLLSPVLATIAATLLRIGLTVIAATFGWPLLLAAAAAALLGIVVHLYKTHEGFRNFVASVLEGAKHFAGALFEFLTFPIRKMIEFWKKGFEFIGNLLPGFADKVTGAMKWIEDKLGIWDGLSTVANTAFEWVKQGGAAMKDTLAGAADSIAGKFGVSFAGIGAAGGSMFDELAKKGQAAIDKMNAAAGIAKAPAKTGGGLGTGGGGGGEGGGAAAMGNGVGPAAFVDWGIYLSGQAIALKKSEEAFRASQMRIAAAAPQYTLAWLNARRSLVDADYAEDLRAAGDNAAKIAQAQITHDTAMRDAIMANQDAILAHWTQTHQAAVLVMQSVSSAYDSVVDQIIQKERSLDKIRRAAWESFKRTFITGVAQMFKHWVTESIKAHIVSDALGEKSAARQRYIDAKAGAVKAFQAFAGIPIVGPALGIAAAAAAFAFLIAFNRGGLVPGFGDNRDSVPAVLTPHEFVIRQESVSKVGTEALSYINQTGRLPQTGGVTFAPSFHIQGSREFVDDMNDYIDKEIIPRLEDAARDGRLRVTRRAILST